MLHMAEETSIFFPLLVDDRFLHCFYISISAIGKNKYTEEHLQICESLRIPLANALTVLLQRRSESLSRSRLLPPGKRSMERRSPP